MVTLVLLGLLFLPFLIFGGITSIIWKRKRRAVRRWTAISYLIAAGVLLLGVGPYLAAWALTHAGTRPPDKALKETPADYGVPYEDIVLEARDSVRLSGWFIPPAGRNAILLCTHGLFRNRVEMLSRAMAACRAGYGALLYDSRSHGASDKGLISLGYHERNDVLGAIQYIQRRYQDAPERPRIVLLGISMGAVATLEAAAETRNYSALILDSPFSSLRQTVVDHSWLFLKMPRYPFPSLFLFWLEQFAGFDPDLVDAHAALQRAQPVPTLIIASEGDERMSASVARALYEEAKSSTRRLKVFGKDVSHGAAARKHPDEYAALLIGFLDTALAEKAASATAHQPLTRPTAKEDYPR